MEESRLPRETERRRVTVMFADITGFTSLTERSDTEQAYEVVTGCLKLLDGIARKHGGSRRQVPRRLHHGGLRPAPRPRGGAQGGRERGHRDAPAGARVQPRGGHRPAPRRAHRDQHRARHLGRRQRSDPARVRGDGRPGEHRGAPEGPGAPRPRLRRPRDPALHRRRVRVPAAPGAHLEGQEREGAELRAALPARTALPRAGRALPFDLLGPRGPRGSLADAAEPSVAALRAGRGGIAAVVADAGLGKTRLVDELRRSLEAEDIGWQEGRAVPIGRTLAYHAIADLLRSWAGITEDDEDQSARTKLEAAIGGAELPDAAAVLPVLASITGLRLGADDRRRLRQTPGDAMDHVIVRATTEILRSAARRRPFVLFFEDLHWADAALDPAARDRGASRRRAADPVPVRGAAGLPRDERAPAALRRGAARRAAAARRARAPRPRRTRASCCGTWWGRATCPPSSWPAWRARPAATRSSSRKWCARCSRAARCAATRAASTPPSRSPRSRSPTRCTRSSCRGWTGCRRRRARCSRRRP